MDAQQSQRNNLRRRPLGVIAATATSLLAISACGILTLFHHHRNANNNHASSINNDLDHPSVRRRRREQQVPLEPTPTLEPTSFFTSYVSTDPTTTTMMTTTANTTSVDPQTTTLNETLGDPTDPTTTTMTTTTTTTNTTSDDPQTTTLNELSDPVQTLGGPTEPSPSDTDECDDDPTFVFSNDKTCQTFVSNVGRPVLLAVRCGHPTGIIDENGDELLARHFCRKACGMCHASAISFDTFPVHTDPIETTSSTPTTPTSITSNTVVATQTSNTVPAADNPKPAYWYPIETPDGITRCVYNADYPEEYDTSTSGLLFFTQDACQTKFEADTSTVVANTASTTVTKLVHWWPIKPQSDGSPYVCVYSSDYPDDYLHHYVKSLVLFDTEEQCCSTYNDCQSPTITTIATIPNFQEYWYPKQVDTVPTCVHDSNYPAEYTANPEFHTPFLFDSQLECCAAFPMACVGMFWYPNAGRTECVLGYDEEDNEADNEEHLFLEREECCAVIECGGGDDAAGSETLPKTPLDEINTSIATTVPTTSQSPSLLPTQYGISISSAPSDQPSFNPSVSALPSFMPSNEPSFSTASPQSSTTTATITAAEITSTTSPDPCSDCTWHESITAYETCTNSPSYPPLWDDAMARAYFFFETAQECCDLRFPERCTVEDVVVGSATTTTRDDGAGSETQSKTTLDGITTLSTITTPTSIATTTTSIIATKLVYWWVVKPSEDGSPYLCVYSSEYPDDYLHHSVMSFVLFDTEEQCCSTYHDCQPPPTDGPVVAITTSTTPATTLPERLM